MKEMYGGYTFPSNELAKLVEAAERAVQICFKENAVHQDMFITCLRYIKLEQENLVGCLDHMHEVSKKVIKFYIVMRMFFVSDRKNLELEEKQRLRKQHAKQSKLT